MSEIFIAMIFLRKNHGEMHAKKFGRLKSGGISVFQTANNDGSSAAAFGIKFYITMVQAKRPLQKVG